jgi:hypothetical protein
MGRTFCGFGNMSLHPIPLVPEIAFRFWLHDGRLLSCKNSMEDAWWKWLSWRKMDD